MGFSANGKQNLLPEEALYLMECVSGSLNLFSRVWFTLLGQYCSIVFIKHKCCNACVLWNTEWWHVSVLCDQGNLQVFYQNLPLSIQDGYEKFLSSSTVSLQQYQVQINTQRSWRTTALLNSYNDSLSSQRCSHIWRGSATWCTDSIPGIEIRRS